MLAIMRQSLSKGLLFNACIMILHRICNADLASETKKVPEDITDKHVLDSAEFNDMEKAIQQIESLSLIKQTYSNVGEAQPDVVIKVYNSMIAVLDDITKDINHSDNLSKFLKANGIIRVLSTNLVDANTRLRIKLLLLLKAIFNKLPTTEDIPLNIVDRLMDIFENDDNLAAKTHTLDILYKWLPNNPKIQVRVMKVKGLEPFYDQVEMLEISSIQNLIDLFNKILTEHINARNNKTESIEDIERMVIYQRIGLLERLSTPKVCRGLLNIFEILWTYNGNEINNVKTVLDVIKNLKPFCLNIYKNIPKAVETFESLHKYVKTDHRKDFLEQHHVNVTDVTLVIEDYLKKEVKDEL